MRKKIKFDGKVEFRAEDLKSLTEQRSEKIQRMKDITAGAENEKRAFSEDEEQEFDNLDKEVKRLDSTIERMERARNLTLNTLTNEKHEEVKAEEAEYRAFEQFLRSGKVEQRADVNMTTGANGAVIPASIANKIITAVKDICPIMQMAEVYNVGGTLTIPVYSESTSKITMAYATEFSSLESSAGTMTNIVLTGFLAGVLTKISKSLINNSSFDIVGFVIGRMSEAIAVWIENELLNGTENKIAGLSGVTQVVNAGSATEVTADELIDLQETVPDIFQGNCIWIMNKATRTAIRKLKDGDNNYLLNKDATSKWGYTLFGKDVYTSDNMSKMAAGKTAIYYGDMTGLAVKMSENVELQVLLEKYATEHAVGIVGYLEMDAKIQNVQKISKLVMKSGA